MQRHRFLFSLFAAVLAAGRVRASNFLSMSISKGYNVRRGGTRNGEHFTMKSVTRNTLDLTGQVCADSIGTRQYSGVGGQADFMRGAALSEGESPSSP